MRGLWIDHDADNFRKGEELGNSFSMLFLCKKVSTFLEKKGLV